MSEPTTLEVGDLPDHAFGSRDPAWWGLVLMMAIEGTMMVLLMVSYFYLRGNYQSFPPTSIGTQSRLLALAGAVVLAVSCVPMLIVRKAARRAAVRTARLWMVIATLLGLAFLVLRIFELRGLPFRWATHAYGSLIWTTLGLHTFHAVTGVVENLAFTALLFKRSIEPKYFVDLDLNAVLWFFVVLEWIPICAIFYGEGLLFGH
jgi:cytochrome c oxidase subunit 3